MTLKIEIEKLGVNNYRVVARNEFGSVVRVESTNTYWLAVEKKRNWKKEI